MPDSSSGSAKNALMLLTHRTELALRLLMLLGVAADARVPLPIPEAAERLRVSPHHLAKVAQDLAHLGVIETVRGRNGGVVLPEASRRRSVGEIVRGLESVVLAECFEGGADACVLAPACRLAAALREAGEAFLASLDRHTIEALVRRPAALRRLVALPRGSAR